LSGPPTMRFAVRRPFTPYDKEIGQQERT
jgi:hypothetical protein